MQRKFLAVFLILALAILSPGAHAAAAKTGPADLPAVQNESASAAIPVVSPAQGAQTAPEPEAVATPAAARFKSMNEAREKIRKAYLLRQYDQVIDMGRAAVEQFPDSPAFEFYVKMAEEKLKPTDLASEKSPAFKRLRDQRRNASIQSIMKAVGQSTATTQVARSGEATPAATQASAQKASAPKAEPNMDEEPAPAPPAARPQPAPVRAASAMDNIKAKLRQPAIMYGAAGVVVLILVGAALAKRKKQPKPAKAEKAEASAESLEAQPAAAATTGASLDEMDSLFGPSPAQPAPAAEKSEDDLDALFGAAAEPTRASVPEVKPEPEPDPHHDLEIDAIFNQKPEPEPEPTLSAPIRLDDSPIDLPSIEIEPEPAVAPITLAPQPEPIFEPIQSGPITLDEPVAPISLSIPDADPFYKEAKEENEEAPTAKLDFSTLDLPSIEETHEEPKPSADMNAFLQPIMPETMDPPSALQPDLASTQGFNFDEPPTAKAAEEEETAIAEVDLPSVDMTPSVAVHEDDTLALAEETREIDQETVVSPKLESEPMQEFGPAAEPEINSAVTQVVEEKPAAGDDLFSREYQKGMSEFGVSNWTGAVHHLSIAAALKPASVEVKEKLREARRRRKETEGE